MSKIKIKKIKRKDILQYGKACILINLVEVKTKPDKAKR